MPGEGRDSVDGGLLVIIRFRSTGDVGDLVQTLRQAGETLQEHSGDQGELRSLRISRAVDDPTLVVLTMEWESVGAYRRALSSFEVKVSVVPVLSQAIDEPTAFEIVHAREGHEVSDSTGSLARDADTVSLGEAAAGFVPPAP